MADSAALAKFGLKAYWEGSAFLRRARKPVHVRKTPAGTVWEIGGGAYIEPRWGFVISEDGRLIQEPLVPNWNAPKAPWRFAVPDPLEFRRIQRDRDSANVLRFDEVVILRDLYEWNYYHFLFDTLGRLGTLAKYVDLKRVPVVLGKYADTVPFVRQILQTGLFADMNWIVDDRYIHAETIWSANAVLPPAERVEFALDTMGIDPFPTGSRRTFLNRGEGATRRIENIAEIRAVLAKHGFQEIDAATLSFQEQVTMFQETRDLVAVHGAGLANIVYRRRSPLTVLELYNHNSFDFRFITRSMGGRWDGLRGRPGPGPTPHANFTISPSLLNEKLRELFSPQA